MLSYSMINKVYCSTSQYIEPKYCDKIVFKFGRLKTIKDNLLYTDLIQIDETVKSGADILFYISNIEKLFNTQQQIKDYQKNCKLQTDSTSSMMCLNRWKRKLHYYKQNRKKNYLIFMTKIKKTKLP